MLKHLNEHQIRNYIENRGWRLRISGIKVDLYTKENEGEVLLPTAANTGKRFICMVALAMIAESEERDVGKVISDIFSFANETPVQDKDP